MAEVIAGISFALQIYASIVDIYKILSKIQGLDKDAPILLWKLRMQQVRFEVFGRHWGLDKPGFNAFIEEEGLLDIMTTTLKSMSDMFDDGNRLEKIYGVQIEGRHVSGLITSNGESVKEDTKKVSMVGRVKWALRDKAKFEKLIFDLREYNDSLHSLLRLREATVLEKLAQSMLLQGVTTPETSRALAQASQESAAMGTHLQQAKGQRLYRQLQQSLETRRFLLEQQSVMDGTASPSRTMVLDQRSVRYAPLNSPSDVLLMAEVMDSGALMSAIVDWRDTNVDERVRLKVLKRLDKLAELLSSRISKPDDIRVLECLGYFEDPYVPRHGFVHRIPQGSESRPPISLYELMARQHEKVPDLNDRFVLARTLAISMLRLHDCGWLHTSFRSSNVIFFHQRRPGQESVAAPWSTIDFSQPYLIGFSYAKPTSLEEVTLEQSKSTLEHSLYRDPILVMQSTKSIDDLERMRVRQQMRHDYYSLGIVLLEIGLWDQITTLWKSKYTRPAFLEKLLTSYVPKLGPKMGAVYRDVVHRLLSGSSGTSSADIADENMENTDIMEVVSLSENSSDWSIATELLKCSA